MFPVIVAVVVLSWLVAYKLIGGTFPQPLVGGRVSWGMRLRSLVATLVAVALAAFVVTLFPR